MNEALRLEIVQRRQTGMSLRAIADELGISERTLYRKIKQYELED